MKCYRNAMLLSIINEVTSGGHKDGSLSHKWGYTVLTWTLFLGKCSSLQAFTKQFCLKNGPYLRAFIVALAAA